MKNFIRVECDTIRVFKLKKGPRQMISTASRLYRIDDYLMSKDTKTDDCFIVYDIDDTQPYMIRPRVVDPDFTRALIDSAKLSGNKKSIWANLNTSKLWEVFALVAVVGSIAYGFMVGGF